MIDVNDLRKGTTFEYEGKLLKVLEYSHNKPGRGNATIRVKTLDLRTGTNMEMTFQSGFRVQDARLDFHNVQYLYNDGDFYHFMDLVTYDQPAIKADVVGGAAGFLTENLELKLTFYDGEPIDIELPLSVELKVVEAQVAVRGDTATGVNKRVKVATGIDVTVPAFVNQGDTIRVDTRDGTYLTRV